ncbi:MAG: sigma-70 family RNA polymerase sigma factor [Bacteroidales bacterium]|jgi:RNA polymerase sigma-70 factor (ECF subfamily)|nr:sigma-70 family RNA polymerase sigma factor [Bacteroidales bacterium]
MKLDTVMNAEQSIIEGCKAGKRRFQNRLYSMYSRSLFTICLRYSKNKEEAEDLLQDCFIKIFEHIYEYRGEGSFEGWLKRITINTAISRFKKNSKLQVLSGLDGFEELARDDDKDAEESFLISDVQSQWIMDAIQELPSGYNHVFNLHIFEGYTHKEIGSMLGVSENTSKSQLSKARKYLQNKLSYLVKG